MNAPITNKRQMYRELIAGKFGNTVPQYLDYETWRRCPDKPLNRTWGIRSMEPGGPSLMNVHPALVGAELDRLGLRAGGYNISLMVDTCFRVMLWAEIVELPGGLYVYAVENPWRYIERGGTWRGTMPTQGTVWERTAARALMARYLNPLALSDLQEVLEAYPGHVVELSATERTTDRTGMPLGTLPGRNAVVWEVRGGY